LKFSSIERFVIFLPGYEILELKIWAGKKNGIFKKCRKGYSRMNNDILINHIKKINEQ